MEGAEAAPVGWRVEFQAFRTVGFRGSDVVGTHINFL
jgi:hypothetical protein